MSTMLHIKGSKLKELVTRMAKIYMTRLLDENYNTNDYRKKLTELAGKHTRYATIIATLIEKKIDTVPEVARKLDGVRAIDDIVRSFYGGYQQLFNHCIVNLVCDIFRDADYQQQRTHLFAMRRRWAGVFPETLLYELDIRIQEMDNYWPIMAVISGVDVDKYNPNLCHALKTRKRKLQLELESTTTLLNDDTIYGRANSTNAALEFKATHSVSDADTFAPAPKQVRNISTQSPMHYTDDNLPKSSRQPTTNQAVFALQSWNPGHDYIELSQATNADQSDNLDVSKDPTSIVKDEIEPPPTKKPKPNEVRNV